MREDFPTTVLSGQEFVGGVWRKGNENDLFKAYNLFFWLSNMDPVNETRQMCASFSFL